MSIESAGQSVVADMFLYNSDHPEDKLSHESRKDESRIKYILYRVQEGTGMCTY
jgi:hypothetical protein